MPWTEFSLILNAVLIILLGFITFFQPAFNEWFAETFLSKARKREKHRKLLGQLKMYVLQYIDSSLLRINHQKQLKREGTEESESETLRTIDENRREARNFLVANKHEFSSGIQEDIQALLDSAMLQKIESALATYRQLTRAIEAELAES